MDKEAEEDMKWTLQAMADELKPGCFYSDCSVDAYITQDFDQEWLRWHSFTTLTVDSLRNYGAWEIASRRCPSLIEFEKMRDEWQKYSEDDNNCENKTSLIEVANTPYDLYFKQ